MSRYEAFQSIENQGKTVIFPKYVLCHKYKLCCCGDFAAIVVTLEDYLSVHAAYCHSIRNVCSPINTLSFGKIKSF